MKVLLIYPPNFNLIPHNWPELFEKIESFYPPLGLLYIASYIKQNTSHKIKILDAQVEKLSYNDIKNKIKKYKPDVVGIYTSTFMLIDALLVARTVKSVDKNIHITIGGPHPTLYPYETVNLQFVDSAVMGEGELTFLELLEKLDKNKPLKGISGVVFKENGQTIINPIRPFIENIDILPFPDRTLVPYKDYFCFLSDEKYTTTMLTSRGCPYKCTFCYRSMGNKYRKRSVTNIIKEIEEIKKLGINDIFFIDDTFTVDKNRIIDLCDEIIRKKLNIKWEVRGRVDNVNYSLLKKMKEAGCTRIGYGIETGNQKTLNILKKGTTIEQVKKIIRDTKEAGILTYGDFMLGSPCETKDDILNTIRFAKKLKLDFAQFTITTPYPGTELFQMGIKKGIINSEKWLNFAKRPTKNFSPDYWTEYLSKHQLIKLLNYAYKTFYLRPSYILYRIKKIRSLRELIRQIKTALRVVKLDNERL